MIAAVVLKACLRGQGVGVPSFSLILANTQDLPELQPDFLSLFSFMFRESKKAALPGKSFKKHSKQK